MQFLVLTLILPLCIHSNLSDILLLQVMVCHTDTDQNCFRINTEVKCMYSEYWKKIREKTVVSSNLCCSVCFLMVYF